MSPWEHAVSVLAAAFTDPIARGLALVAIVIGGLTFMYGEGQAKRQLAGIVFGGGMALAAAQFLAWLFPTA
jgi:type IV secretory pathway VirB2 component (pilin)